ncbi:hypothetical protein J2T55_001978 [Methylohalomonas lacus]|uniref:DUF3619 family protein n=1 Tax=Methylohalomonas lacus TaxID=398773 RepID=A0AAE3HMK9_9GAMM|nr:hypothetical protein [Methylohalomonas lacus]MCS3903946.1 hypothetical protein [Methylohalomonas lacus]
MTAPDSADLPGLIRNAFDALPGPDEERLGAIRQRLPVRQPQRLTSRQPHRLKWILWLVLLGSGTVTAGWWLGTGSQQAPEKMNHLGQSSPEANVQSDGKADTSSASDENERRRSPIIYQR